MQCVQVPKVFEAWLGHDGIGDLIKIRRESERISRRAVRNKESDELIRGCSNSIPRNRYIDFRLSSIPVSVMPNQTHAIDKLDTNIRLILNWI